MVCKAHALYQERGKAERSVTERESGEFKVIVLMRTCISAVGPR